MVEKVKPTARLAAMNSTTASESSHSEPSTGTPNMTLPASRMTATWT